MLYTQVPELRKIILQPSNSLSKDPKVTRHKVQRFNSNFNEVIIILGNCCPKACRGDTFLGHEFYDSANGVSGRACCRSFQEYYGIVNEIRETAVLSGQNFYRDHA